MAFLKHVTANIKQIVPKVEKASLYCSHCRKVIENANGDKKCPFCSRSTKSSKD
jgi:Zn finger protein HypA/HybF involved in hydrogenase expression